MFGVGHRLLLTLGSKLLSQERWALAAALLGRSAALAPDNWRSHANLACALLKLGRWEEAAGVAQRAIRLRPDVWDSHDYFAIALLKLERWDEAVAAYSRGLAAAPASPQSHDRLWTALSRLGRWEEAAAMYRRALQLTPMDRRMLERLGTALAALNQWEEATEAFRRASGVRADYEGLFRHFPADYTGSIYRGLLAQQTDATDGFKQFADGLAALPSSPEILAAHQNAVALAPQEAVAHLGLGIELLKQGHFEEAERVLGRGATLTEVNAVFHFLRVDPLMRLGRLSDALEAHALSLTRRGGLPALPGGAGRVRFEAKRAGLWTRGELTDDAFEVDRWLAGLAPPSAPHRQESAVRSPKLLFVLDNDYGELTTLMYMLMGQPLARDATLLLPDRLFAHNADAISGRTHRFATLHDVLAAVEREAPDIVFVCSGYLMAQHGIMAEEDLARLIDALRERRCRVVTSDPFLGILSKYDPHLAIRLDIPPTSPFFDDEDVARGQRLHEETKWAEFSKAERILKSTFHFYPAYCGEPDPLTDPTDARNVSFFNECLLSPISHRARAASQHGESDSRPHWLFVLSRADWDIQVLNRSSLEFVDLVARKLVETAATGRRAILVGPELLIDLLVQRMPTAENIDILAFCGFRQFTSLLMSAEVAFYWNLVSHSILIRLFNGLPIVLFDRGHLARNVAVIEDRIIHWYYQGLAPACRDDQQRLTQETVARWIEDQRQVNSQRVERFRRAPSPDEMVSSILNGDLLAT
jgi:Flp pilus assembly protein TadD